jgi:transcriptional regulator with GAF, ATPase, and Fis domain
MSLNPRLASISGPLRDSVFPLKDEVLSVGRELSNRLTLDDGLVAPQHCVVTRDGERWLLRDLGSLTGTFVNGLPVKERPLANGDQIAIGGSVFLFLHEEASEARPNPVQMDDGAEASTATTRLRREDMRYLHPEALAALPTAERIARDLQTLLKISTAIGSVRNVESLQWQLLGMIFDVVPAERGAILLGQDPAEFDSVVAWDRVAGPQHSVHVDRRLAEQVLTERVAALSNDVKGQGVNGHSADGAVGSAERDEFEDESSEEEDGEVVDGERADGAAADVHSLLCVPLVNLDRSIGLIYLDTTNPEIRFAEDDLHLVTAIAGIATMAIESARQVEWLGSENRRLRAEVNLDHDMVGESPKMRDVYQLIERVAASDSTVLIYGESGTGKELAARAIHRNSPRRDHPFVAINCAALTESLLESELFGHERGAFTGAIALKRGQLEMANGGTIFLDEMGEISPGMQAKLLRVLQERDFMRVGGTKTLPLNIRILAATNKNLQKATKDNTFREDLYYRLNVVSITMPALRDHKDDIPLLASYFAAKCAEKCNRRVLGISPDARTILSQYDWPGNIRELENAIERAVVLGSSGMILPEDLPETLHETPAQSMRSSTYHEAVRQLKRQLILTAMDQSDGKYTEAARLLGVHANYLHRLINNLDLRLSLKKKNKG